MITRLLGGHDSQYLKDCEMRFTTVFLLLLGFGYSITVHADQAVVGLDDQSTAAVLDWREGLIEEQSFETELSEYHYPVWFVSYMPTGEYNDVKLKIIQQDVVLEELESYIPDKIGGQTFTSLDAVSFVDYNLDGNTDILLVKTWEDITVSAVYDGRIGDDSKHFHLNRSLSDAMTEDLSEHTISNMIDYYGSNRSNKGTSVFSDDLPTHFAFASGAGAWGTNMDLWSDGTFDGEFRDTDMGGSGDGFDSTVSYCKCHGKFGNIEKHGDYYYSMSLEDYSTEQEIGTTWISEETEGEYPFHLKHIITDPRGIYPGSTYYIFLPGAPLEELPVSLSNPMIGVGISETEPKVLLNWVLYNAEQEVAFGGFY